MASLFLPLLASQILLNNVLSDIPAVGIADDSVDVESLKRPRRWDIRCIGRFMIQFGLLSSVFDFLIFGVLFLLHSGTELFRTGWFVESLPTELAIALVVRTQRPFFRSWPGELLLATTLVMILLTPAIPYRPFVWPCAPLGDSTSDYVKLLHSGRTVRTSPACDNGTSVL